MFPFFNLDVVRATVDGTWVIGLTRDECLVMRKPRKDRRVLQVRVFVRVGQVMVQVEELGPEDEVEEGL